jgi:antitoxin VapB
MIPQHSSDKTAKVFMSGRSQAVRLPMEFRFDAEEVHIRRDAATGDVILSTRPARNWSDFMRLRERLGPAPADFLRDRQQGVQTRDPFEGWQE